MLIIEQALVAILYFTLTFSKNKSQLSLVSLSLIRTLIDLNCEDLMLQLVFKLVLLINLQNHYDFEIK